VEVSSVSAMNWDENLIFYLLKRGKTVFSPLRSEKDLFINLIY